MLEKHCIVLDYHGLVDSCDLTDKANLNTFEVEAVSYKTKIMPFGLLCYKGEAVLSKKISPSYPGLSVHVHCQDIRCGN